jgi:CheY-like chemotaxis protein/HPt (histidine-containing phosphotransfer) domain-containing protein
MVPLKILVVDDDDVSRELLDMLLMRQGYRTVKAGSGEQALALLEEPSSLPDAILTDLQMPGLSGSALAAELRRRCPAARLVAISGSAPAASAIEGYDGFLLKPFRMEALREILTRESQAPTEETASPPAESGVLDQGIYQKLQASMPPEKLAQLYRLCLSDVRRRVETMGAAAETGDDAVYRREAHAIKGGCGMVGAVELQTIAAVGENHGIPANHVATCHEFIEATDRLERMLFAHGHTKETSSAVESVRSNA